MFDCTPWRFPGCPACEPTFSSARSPIPGASSKTSEPRQGLKVTYLVSHRALADQKFLDFSERIGERAKEPLARVALSTGDRTEGNVDAEVCVATYEKAIGLLLTGQIRPGNSLVIADELQILCDPSRLSLDIQ
jgi:helicase